METNNSYTVKVYRRWILGESATEYVHRFYDYASAQAHYNESIKDIARFMTAIANHSARVEMLNGSRVDKWVEFTGNEQNP